MDWATRCFWIAGGAGALWVALMTVFYGAEIMRSVISARPDLALWKLMWMLVSWPVRYFTYRSGHGRHAAYA